MNENATNETRHGKRKKGTATMSTPMPASLKAELAVLAKKDNRSLAAWTRLKLTEIARRSRAAQKGLAK